MKELKEEIRDFSSVSLHTTAKALEEEGERTGELGCTALIGQ
jgi:hypothetical protein